MFLFFSYKHRPIDGHDVIHRMTVDRRQRTTQLTRAPKDLGAARV